MLTVDAMLMFSITPLAGLAFKDEEFPRLLNVSYSTVFKSSDVEGGGETSYKKKAVAWQSLPPPDADLQFKTLV